MSVTRFFVSLKSLCAVITLIVMLTPIFAQTPDFPKPTPEVNALVAQARTLRLANKLDEAEAIYQKAFEKARATKDRAGEALTMVSYSAQLERKNQLEGSQKMLDEGTALARQIGAKSVEVAAMTAMGNALYTKGKPLLAAERFEEARILYHAMGDRNSEAGMLMNLGVIYDNIGQVPKAIPLFEQVLPIFRELKDKRSEANALTNLGKALRKIGEWEKSKPYDQQALALFRELDDKPNQANLLIAVAANARNQGDIPQAARIYNEALTLAKEGKSPDMEGRILSVIGTMHQEAGEMTQALEYNNRALQISRTTKNLRLEADTLNNIAIVYSRTGLPQKAMETYQQAIQLYEGLSDKSGILSATLNMGYLSSDMRRFTQAEGYFLTALTLAKELHAAAEMSRILNGLASVAKAQRNYSLALSRYQQALALTRQYKDRDEEAAYLGNIGYLHWTQRKYPQAHKFMTESLALYRQLGNRNGISNMAYSLGTLSRDMKRPLSEVEAFYRQAATEAQSTGNRIYLANAYNGLGIVASERKRHAQAIKYSAESVALWEEVRAASGSSAAQSEFFAESLQAYTNHLLFLSHIRAGREMFEFAQKIKARSLLDTLAYGRVNLDSVLTEEEHAKEQTLRGRANSLNERMVREGVINEPGAKKRFAALKAELQTTERELQALTDALYARHPELAQRRVAKTATLKEMGRVVPADTALLEYVPITDETIGVLVVTTVRGKARVSAYELLTKGLGKETAAFRLACSDPRKAWKPGARALYRRLIAPAAKELRGKKRLIICPDGVLWDVPFAALLRGNRTLGSRYALSSAYSATGAQAAHALAQERRRQVPKGSVLVVANPDFGTSKRFGDLNDLPGQRPLSEPSRPLSEPSRPLPEPARPLAEPSRSVATRLAAAVPVRGGYIASLAGTQREADAIKALFANAEVLTHEKAQEAKVKSDAGKYQYLHFATHGFVNDAAPMLSSVLLAAPNAKDKEDGFLTAREVYAMNLNAEMAVLSACNTGRGETRSGEGIIGLTWALLCAGCPSQVVSQWSVDDAATAKLMSGFYRSLKAGQNKATSLRTAARSLRSTPKYRHPYYWAAFVLMGE